MAIQIHETHAELDLAPHFRHGGPAIKVPMQVCYRHNQALPGNRVDPPEPASIEIVSISYQINGQWIGVEEMAGFDNPDMQAALADQILDLL